MAQKNGSQSPENGSKPVGFHQKPDATWIIALKQKLLVQGYLKNGCTQPDTA